MSKSNKIDRFEEILRLIYLDQIKGIDAEQLRQEMLKLIDNNKGSVSQLKEKEMMSKLLAVMQQPSFGQLIENVIKRNSVEERLLVEKTGLTSSVISDLKRDAIYPNNVPIQLFKKLVIILELPFMTVKSAVLKTFAQLKQQTLLNETTTFGYVPAFRKGYEHTSYESSSKANDVDGKDLFENEEALNKYLNRLEELMTE